MRASSSDLEIELKLMVDPADLGPLADGLAAGSTTFSAPRTQTLESRYFDTPDLQLEGRRAGLRVRRIGDRFIQTVKTASTEAAAHAVRGEWECEVETMRPDLERMSDPRARAAIGPVAADGLRPVFTTRIERRLMLVERDLGDGERSIVEVAIDSGSIETCGSGGERRIERVAEVELELQAGPLRGLYLLLETLRAQAPLRIAMLSKAERGYRLATGRTPPAQKANRPALEPCMTVGRAMGVVLGSCLQQILRNDAPARDGRNPKAVHQLRVGLRRTRSALALFATALAPGEREAWDARLQAAIEATGRARELDVLSSQTLPEVASGLPDEPALKALEAAVLAAREGAGAELRSHLESRGHADLLLDLVLWVALERWREGADDALAAIQAAPVVELALPLLDRRYARLRKKGRHFRRLDDARRHEVRLALKKLRYGVEFLSGLYPGKTTRHFARAAARLQDRLGRLNDQVETRRLLESLPAAEAGVDRAVLERGIGMVVGWQAEAIAAARRKAIRGWHRFRKEKPFWPEAGGGRAIDSLSPGTTNR